MKFAVHFSWSGIGASGQPLSVQTDFSASATYDPAKRRKDADCSDDDLASLVDRARREVMEKQVRLGLDIITDGEIERETYYLHVARNFSGIDFANTKKKPGRAGACTFNAPTVVGKLELKV